MRRPIRWSRAALDDFKLQIAYVAADKPNAARTVANRINQAVVGLGDMPTGRAGRVAGTYEKLAGRLPYVIAYAIGDVDGRSTVVILRIIHTARDWPRDAWPD